MKFILNENKKFVLEERFVLTEATAAENAQKWTAQLFKTFDNTKAVLEKYIEYAGISKDKNNAQEQLNTLATNLKDAAENFEIVLRQPLADITADLGSAKMGLKACLDALTEAARVFKDKTSGITTSPENLTNLNKIVGSLTLLYNATTWSAANITKLKQLIEKATELGTVMFNVSDFEADRGSVQSFQEDCEKCQELLREIQTTLSVDFDFTNFSAEDLADYQKEVKQIIDSVQLQDAGALNKGLVVANFNIYWKQVKLLKASYTAITDLLSLYTTNQKDWKSKLAGAVNKDTVIQEFIYTVWPKEASKVLKIKETLLPECEAYGFEIRGEQRNPFVSFISNVYLKYGELTPEKYNIIHNLTAENYLTGKDLIGEGDMGFGNLIFCKALYSLDAKVIKLYVKKQYNLLKAASKDTRFKTNAELAFNTLYNLAEIASGNATKNSASLTLRPMNDVERLEAKWTGSVSEIAEDGGNKKKIASNAALIQQINTTENAIKVLAALAIKFSSNDKIVALAQSCKESRELMAKSTTLGAIQKLVASVERLYKIESINATQALNLIKSILESDQFDLTLE